MEQTRVCMIGAGPSGLAVMNAFAKAKDNGAIIPEIVCYEQQETCGGLWNLTWRTGLDSKGYPLHQSMYPHLWSNAPKEALEFADYTFDTHFGFPISSFPPRPVIRDYLEGKMKSTKQEIEPWIQYKSRVMSVTFDDVSQKFTVTVSKDGVSTEETFDNVICGTGHFSTPNVPEFPGIESFKGRVLHSHDFRQGSEFKDKTVLIVGTSYSAEDIASQCYKFGAKSLVCSYRTNPMQFKWPSNFTIVPLLKEVEGNKCTFVDGTVINDIDAIIFCTGYVHNLTFMAPELRLETANRLWVDTLYEGIVWPSNPKLMYIGMQNQFFSFPMFQAQAHYIRDVILGRIEIPDKSTMESEFSKWREEELSLELRHEPLMIFQANYVKHIMDQTDCPKFDVMESVKCFLEWDRNKEEDIMTFRDQVHKSFLTGTESVKPSTPWVEEVDDSYDHYVSIYKTTKA